MESKATGASRPAVQPLVRTASSKAASRSASQPGSGPARLNGCPVQVVVRPAGSVPVPEGRASACRRITQAAVQALWAWSPWAQPEPPADGGTAHYLALARQQVASPPTDAQLQCFVKAVMAREVAHGFFRLPMAELRTAYAALAQVLDLPSGGAGLLGRIVDALQAAGASPLHRLSAAEALARAVGASRLAPAHLGHLLRILDPGASADPGWCAMLVGMLCAVLDGPRIQPAQLDGLVRAIFSSQRSAAADAPVRRAQVQALAQGLGERAQVRVPGLLWGHHHVTRLRGLTQAQVTQVVRAVLGHWRPEAKSVEQVMGELVQALDACLPKTAQPQAHRWIAQALMQHFLDPRSQVAGVPFLPGMDVSVAAKQSNDITSVGCLGLAAALLASLPNDVNHRLALMVSDLVAPALRASARLSATRLRPMAHYQFAAAMAAAGPQGLVLAMTQQPPTAAMLEPVLSRIGALSLQQAGAWLGGAFGGLAVRVLPHQIHRDEADRFRTVVDLCLLVLSVTQVLVASQSETRLSRVALVGYETGCCLLKGHTLDACRQRVAAFMPTLVLDAFVKLSDDHQLAFQAGLAMALLQRFPDPQALEGLLIDNLPEPRAVPPASNGQPTPPRPTLARPARQAQVHRLRDALALAQHPAQVVSDPRFATGDDAVEMLLLAHAMPRASGADDLNHGVAALNALKVPAGVRRQALARVAGQRGTELTPPNFTHVHRAMLGRLLEAALPLASAKADGKREVRGPDEDAVEGDSLHFEPAAHLLQFYEELRECSGLMFVFGAGDADPAQLRANEPAIRHLLALLDSAQGDVRALLKGPSFAQTRVLVEGTLKKIRLPLQQALQALTLPREKKAK